MSISRIQKGFAAKVAALFLALLLFNGNLAFSVQTSRTGQAERDLEGPFKWAAADYQAGQYHNVLNSLELLLSYYSENEDAITPKAKQLKGKIHLLLGATYEKLRSQDQARQQYRLAKEILSDPRIENVDLAGLPLYRSIFMPASLGVDQGIIIKPKIKKKKRISPLLIVATVAVIAGGLALALIGNKKKEAAVDIVTDFDTRELGIQWVSIPGGEFLMGDNFGEGDPDEYPVHTVYIDGYRISKYEITFEQFDRFCELTARTKPNDSEWGRGNRPVVNIPWIDANAFCTWLSEKTGKKIQLPSEAQWELAAKGGGQIRYPWGNQEATPGLCNFSDHQGQTLPVGSFPDGVSPYGVHDMAGNAAEWCRDEYTTGFYTTSPLVNPVNLPVDGYRGYLRRSIRGGSWQDDWRYIRASDRSFGGTYQGIIGGSATTYNNRTGFRIVLGY